MLAVKDVYVLYLTQAEIDSENHHFDMWRASIVINTDTHEILIDRWLPPKETYRKMVWPSRLEGKYLTRNSWDEIILWYDKRPQLSKDKKSWCGSDYLIAPPIDKSIFPESSPEFSIWENPNVE
jgi:hypothetical protein